MLISRLDNRIRIKGLLAPIGATATAMACLAVGLPAAQAVGDGDSGTDPVFGTWAWSRFTDHQTDPTPPADPDHEAGEENLANVVQIGELFTQDVPGELTTEDSGWVRTRPAGDGWLQLPGVDGEKRVEDSPAKHETTDWQRTSPGNGWLKIDERQVVDRAAVEGQWMNYSWKGGPVTGAPAFPDSKNWQGNNGNHNGHPQPSDADKPGLTYQQGEPGNADWFHWEFEGQVDAVSHTEYRFAKDTAPMAHQEFRYERQVTTMGHVEYYWSVYVRTNTAGQPTGGDPTEPTLPTDPTVPTVPTVPAVPVPAVPTEPSLNGGASGPTVPGGTLHGDKSPQQTESSPRPAAPGAVPLSIDAGL